MTDVNIPVLHDLVLDADALVVQYAGQYSFIVWVGVAALFAWLVSRKAGYGLVGWLLLSIVFWGFLLWLGFGG